MASDLSPVEQFTGLRLDGLGSYDILELSYCAARGLPGTEKSDLDAWLAKCDEWAARVRFETCRHLYRFNPKSKQPQTPLAYGDSLARFFCYFLLQVLQQDCGVRYHPDRKFKPDFCQPRDVFAHGIMDDDGHGGTCASMPVVYVSVGKRLGFPIHLVETRGHLFFRWDDPKGTVIRWQNPDLVVRVPPDRFNVDGSGEGIAYHDDSFYTEWPEKWTEIDVRHGRFLRSMTAKEELAAFLIERGECFWDLGRHEEALTSYGYARQLVRDDERYNQLHLVRFQQHLQMREIEAHIRQRERNRLLHQHGPSCTCLECSKKRAAGAPFPHHGPSCTCLECSKKRTPVAPFPDHGPSCQCLHCRKHRDAQIPLGLPGHPSVCGCAGCLRVRRSRPMPGTFPGMPSFDVF
jgi:hypothetical protein